MACDKRSFSRSFKSTHFQIIFGSPRNTMRLDISHYNYYKERNRKSYLRRCIFSNEIVFFHGFLSCPHYLFVSSQMFSCKLVFTLTNYILKHENDVLKKTKLPKLLKVTNKSTTGITERCSNSKYITLFLCSY